MPVRVPRLSLLLLVPFGVLWGCASGSKTTAPSTGGSAASGPITVSAADRSTQASLQGSELTGPQLSVNVDEDEARGSVTGATVFLTLKPTQISGTVGTSETRIKVETQEAGLTADGTFAGRPVSLVFSGDTLQGQFVSCSYALTRSSSAPETGTGGSGELTYEGQRNCAGARVMPVSVTLPAGFTELTPAEQVTILNLVLGH